MALTARRLIICPVAVVTATNAICKQIDTIGGQFTFTTPLRAAGDATNTTVAYWCSWLFDPNILANLKMLAVLAGLTTAETTERPLGFTSTPATLPRLAMFDWATWPVPTDVLAAMGLSLFSASVY